MELYAYVKNAGQPHRVGRECQNDKHIVVIAAVSRILPTCKQPFKHRSSRTALLDLSRQTAIAAEARASEESLGEPSMRGLANRKNPGNYRE